MLRECDCTLKDLLQKYYIRVTNPQEMVPAGTTVNLNRVDKRMTRHTCRLHRPTDSNQEIAKRTYINPTK